VVFLLKYVTGIILKSLSTELYSYSNHVRAEPVRKRPRFARQSLLQIHQEPQNAPIQAACRWLHTICRGSDDAPIAADTLYPPTARVVKTTLYYSTSIFFRYILSS
jgi:hypothetical protein